MFSDYGVGISTSNKSLIRAELARIEELVVIITATVATLTASANDVEITALNEPKVKTSHSLTRFERTTKQASGRIHKAWDSINRLQQIINDKKDESEFQRATAEALESLNHQLQQCIEDYTLSRCLVDHYRGHGAREVHFSHCSDWLNPK